MSKYDDLEMNILSCFLQKPELMKETLLKDEHFVKYKKIWFFLKAVYNKFDTLDITLMCSVVDNKYKFANYIYWLLDAEPTPSRFKLYERQLIDLYNESKKEKWKIEKAYEASNELYMRAISFKEFCDRIEEIKQNAEKIFEEEKK